MALKVSLTKSIAGASERQRATVAGLGLKKFGDVRTLTDSPSVRGMVRSVGHLVTVEEAAVVAPRRERSKPKKIRNRDASRAAAKATR